MCRVGVSCWAQLDVLSATASGGNLQGTITLNGLPRRPAEYRKLCCYVMQRDVLLESATVRRGRLTLTTEPS